MEEISIFVAFGAGVLSFLSPCILPLVPVYLASMAGTSVAVSPGSEQRLAIFSHSLSFVGGFAIIFTVFGAGAGLIGLAVSLHIALIRQIAGVLMVLMGLLLLLALKVPWLNFEKRLTTSASSAPPGYLRSFLIGSVFALGWTPCVGPILGGILALAMGAGTALNGAYLLLVYSLGLGLPFLIIGIAFDVLRKPLRRLQRYSVFIYVISGILLIAVGILVFTNKLALISFSL